MQGEKNSFLVSISQVDKVFTPFSSVHSLPGTISSTGTCKCQTVASNIRL